MAKRGRPTNTQKVLNQLSSGQVQKKTAIATDMFLPNHSGDHSSGIVNSTPTKDTDLVNKKYVDDYGCSPAGNTTEIQFNDAGSFGGDPNLVWDKTNNRLGINEATPEIELHVNGGAIFSNSALAFDQYKMVNIYYEENRNAANLYTALYYDYRVTCTANSSKAYRGHVGVARWESTHDLTGDGEIVGVQASVQTIGSGDVANAKCLIAKNSGSEVGGTGTIDNGYGLIIEDWWGAASVGTHGGGTINTLYGIYIEDLSAATTNYAVFLENDMGIYFRDSALSINSQINGHLDLNADIQIDLNADVYVDGSVTTDSGILTLYTPEDFPDNAVSTGYVDMTENVLLMHLDNDWTDDSGEGNNGTATGATFSTDAKIGSHAGDFDGAGDYVEIANDASLNFGTTSFSASLWIKRSAISGAGECFIYKRKEAADYEGYLIELTASGRILGHARDGTSYNTDDDGAAITDTNWHHVVVVFDRDDDLIKRYVDGSPTGTNKDISACGSIDNTGRLWLGSEYATAAWFNGTIDEVAIWNRSLSASEISNIYNMQAVGKVSGTQGEIAYTKFYPNEDTTFAGLTDNGWRAFM